MFETVFQELAGLLAVTVAIGALGMLLRQPLIVSFIAAGILAGPDVIGLVQVSDYVALFAQLGVTVLLFLVGLQLDVRLVRELGPVAVATGLGQVVFTSIIGFAICLGLGFDWLTGLYIAVALTFSSTIIIVKLLSDKREIDSLHGRIALGFLIVQDLVVVVGMVAVSAFAGDGADTQVLVQILAVVGKSAALLALTWITIRYLATPVLARLARAPELLLLFAVGWAAVFAALADLLDFSKELGGLLAGASLASTPYRDAITSRMNSLRDFLLLFFFIDLGTHFDLRLLGEQLGPALILSAFVLIGNPLIVMLIMGAMGYRKRTGFLAGLTVAQISEFSLVFMALGVSIGHVAPAALPLVTIVGLATIALSTYMILYSNALYAALERLLAPFDRLSRKRQPDELARPTGAADVVMFGMGRYGSEMARRLSDLGLSILAVDFDPEIVRRRRAQGYNVVFGDAGDPDFVESLPLRSASAVVLAFPREPAQLGRPDTRLALPEALRRRGFEGLIAIAARNDPEAEEIAARPELILLQPFADAARHAAETVARTLREHGEAEARTE